MTIIAKLTCRLFGHPPAMSSYEEGAFSPILQDCPRCGVTHEPRNQTSLLLRKLHHGDIIPRGYGIAWVHLLRSEAVAMPIPLNLIAGAVRRTWFWMKAPCAIYDDRRAAYDAGFKDGRASVLKK